MAHNEQARPGEPEVRKYLTEQWREFFDAYTRVAAKGGEAFGKYADDALRPRLHALESGAAVDFTRDDLPPGHPEKAGRSDDSM